MRAALYLRSSKDRSDVSIDAQRRQLHELAEKRNLIIVKEYADAVESGKDDDRPGFQAMISDIKNSKRGWDHILVLDTARIARRRHIGIIFEEHECARNNIKVIYKSLPDSDPITEMLLKSILQAMDEWHSLTSKAKGMAGMAENVRQGWRAGGSAPKGYKLESIQTGAIREGMPVTKSKLVPNDDAMLVRAYLQSRARGLPRAKALELIKQDWPITTLLSMERNALTYAGQTVWGRHAEKQQGGGYVGGSKYKPRDTWVIQKDTHEPLITEAEAETILAAVGATGSRHKPSKQDYLFAGLLKSPDGINWHGNKNAYRLGKGKQIAAHIVEKAVIDQIVVDLSSDLMAERLLEHYKNYAKNKLKNQDLAKYQERIDETDAQITKLANLLIETTKPEALLRKIEELEDTRERLVDLLQEEQSIQDSIKTIRNASIKEIKHVLRSIADLLESQPSQAKDALGEFIDTIIMDESASSATITYKLNVKSRDKLASPRSVELIPTFAPVSTVYFRQRRA